MKRILALFAVIIAPEALAEGTFNYSGFGAGIGFVTIGLDDSDEELNGRTLNVSLTGELSNQFVISVGASHLLIDDTLYEDGVSAEVVSTQATLNLTLGRYFSISPMADITVSATAAFSRYESDTLLSDVYGNTLYFEDSGTDSSVGGRVGARILIAEQGRLELNPSFTFVSNEGENDTILGLGFAFNLTPKASLGLSLNTSTQEDQTSFGAFSNLYF